MAAYKRYIFTCRKPVFSSGRKHKCIGTYTVFLQTKMVALEENELISNHIDVAPRRLSPRRIKACMLPHMSGGEVFLTLSETSVKEASLSQVPQ